MWQLCLARWSGLAMATVSAQWGGLAMETVWLSGVGELWKLCVVG